MHPGGNSDIDGVPILKSGLVMRVNAVVVRYSNDVDGICVAVGALAT